MLTKFKKKVQEKLAAEAKLAHELGLTPNMISIIGVFLAFSSAIIYTQGRNPLYLLLATVVLLLSGFCDALDGVLARLYKQTTKFGGFFDSVLDRYADASVYAGIIIGRLCDPFWGSLALAGSLLVSYTRARAEAAGLKMESVGITERAERILILAAASLIAIFRFQALNIGIIILAVLTNLTVLQRSFYVYKKLKN